MYLKKLYKHSKVWLVFVVSFIAGQLFINYKTGATVSPFFHYGMYSAIANIEEIYPVTVIKVNGNILKTKNFTPQQWDNINLPLVYYDLQKKYNGELWRRDIRRLTHVSDSTKYINTLTNQDFRQWYRSYLTTRLGYPIVSLEIYEETYIYNQYGLNKDQNPAKF